MTPSLAAEAMNYPAFVESLFVKNNKGSDGLLHATIGIAGEAGELLDAIKKHWVYGKPLDIDNVVEELGDIEFYCQALRSLIGRPRLQILEANVTKLRKRYPAGYTDAHAAARLDKVE